MGANSSHVGEGAHLRVIRNSILERLPITIRCLVRGHVMLELKNVLPTGDGGDLLSPEQASVGLSLRAIISYIPLDRRPLA